MTKPEQAVTESAARIKEQCPDAPVIVIPRLPDPLRSKILSVILTGGDVHEVKVTGSDGWTTQDLIKASQELDRLARVKGGDQ